MENGGDINTCSKNGKSPLSAAAERGHFHVVQFLVQNGANVNISDENGNTSVSLAASNGHSNVVKFLVQNGAKINFSNKNGESPATLAAQNDYFDVCCMLIFECGAKLETSVLNKYGADLVARAVADDNFNGVKSFLEKGVGINDLALYNALQWPQKVHKEG